MGKCKVLLVGCGNIGGRFDMNSASTGYSYTHAGAYSRDGRFSIEACIDPNAEARLLFMEYWNIPKGYNCFGGIMNSIGKFDVISICSPTEHHKNDVLNAIKLQPKLIFCEKPVTPCAEDTKLLIEKCKEKNILLAVNYTRRWDSKIEALKADIYKHSRGDLRSVVATYNKGILNNGSHLIDLMHYLFGSLTIAATMSKVFDYSDDDPSIPALLSTKDGVPIHFVIGDARDFALFEVQFIFSSGIIAMKDGGLSWNVRSLVKSDQFSGYDVLDKGKDAGGAYRQAMGNAVNNIYGSLHINEKLISDGYSAYKAQNMCEKIKLF